jgi:hypothetical protein
MKENMKKVFIAISVFFHGSNAVNAKKIFAEKKGLHLLLGPTLLDMEGRIFSAALALQI